MAGLFPPLIISSVDASAAAHVPTTTASWIGITREPKASGETAGAGAPTSLSLGRSGGQAHSRHRRLQSPHRGFVSSHFFLRRLHMRHPVCTRRIRALGKSPIGWFKAPLASRGRQGRLRRRHRAHGTLPSQACLIWAQRWHTGRLSETMMAPAILISEMSRLLSFHVSSPKVVASSSVWCTAGSKYGWLSSAPGPSFCRLEITRPCGRPVESG